MISEANANFSAGLRATLIGGANGAGKSTLASSLLLLEPEPAVFLNADEIQRSSPEFDHPIAAGKELLRQLEATVNDRMPFLLESTLSSVRYARMAQGWKDAGYKLIIHFIQLSSAEFAIERVRRRVAAGGHGIPEADIRRRFARGIANFTNHYRDAFDEWYHWSNDDEGLRLLAAS